MAVAAVERLEQCMPSLDIKGVVICKDDHATKDELVILKKHDIDVQEASHPVPDSRSVARSHKDCRLASKTGIRTYTCDVLYKWRRFCTMLCTQTTTDVGGFD